MSADGDAPRALLAASRHGRCPHAAACARAMRRFVGASDYVTPDPPRWLGCGDCDEFEEEGEGDGDR